MKRLIYSLYKEDIENHQSSGDYKKSHFKKYKNQIEQSQKNYANICGADYMLLDPTNTNYDKIQIEKLLLLEDFTKTYDEVLYLDFDVIPVTDVSFFERFDLNYLCFHEVVKDMLSIQYEKLKNDVNFTKFSSAMRLFTPMNPFVKMAAKNAMLMLDNVMGRETIINTGVVGGNKYSIGLLKLKDKLNMIDEKLEEAREDNIYPDNISDMFFQNNETYMSYLVERFNLPYQEIGQQWNYVLYTEEDYPHSNNHFLHYISKHFHCCFDSS